MAEEMQSAFRNCLPIRSKDLYSAEKQIIKALPKMAKNATNEQLRVAFERHLEETRGHVARLEQIAEEMDFSLARQEVQGHARA